MSRVGEVVHVRIVLPEEPILVGVMKRVPDAMSQGPSSQGLSYPGHVTRTALETAESDSNMRGSSGEGTLGAREHGNESGWMP